MKKREVKLHCPKCNWEPRQTSNWVCKPGCRHSWNTFDTNGACPACGKAWKVTQCLSCLAFSAHADWYHELIRDETTEEQKERVTARLTEILLQMEEVGME
ncbi:MAG: hypothetical protein HY360_10965 [Verrucomicrobia bacterium]|nr:hypothetical protein [Verrucomicrobiota bacterium]